MPSAGASRGAVQGCRGVGSEWVDLHVNLKSHVSPPTGQVTLNKSLLISEPQMAMAVSLHLSRMGTKDTCSLPTVCLVPECETASL